MMQELVDIKGAVVPTDTLLVVDAMTGQEAAQLTKAFDDAVTLTGAFFPVSFGSCAAFVWALCVAGVFRGPRVRERVAACLLSPHGVPNMCFLAAHQGL